jgi:hypothetical protein
MTRNIRDIIQDRIRQRDENPEFFLQRYTAAERAEIEKQHAEQRIAAYRQQKVADYEKQLAKLQQAVLNGPDPLLKSKKYKRFAIPEPDIFGMTEQAAATVREAAFWNYHNQGQQVLNSLVAEFPALQNKSAFELVTKYMTTNHMDINEENAHSAYHRLLSLGLIFDWETVPPYPNELGTHPGFSAAQFENGKQINAEPEANVSTMTADQYAKYARLGRGRTRA